MAQASDIDMRPPPDAALLRMGRAGWAWEWLRRNAIYRSDMEIDAHVHRRVLRSQPLLTIVELKRPHSPKWGLCFAERSEQPYQRAAVFWTPEADASVCPVCALPAADDGTPGILDLKQLKIAVTVLVLPTGEQHVLLCDGANSLQLHVIAGTVLDGPVRLALALRDFRILHDHTQTIERLGIAIERGRFPVGLFTSEPNAARWLLVLKAIDMEAVGASHAEIAASLYAGTKRGNGFATDWRRSRVRRLLETGHAFIDGDYRKLLGRNGKAGTAAA